MFLEGSWLCLGAEVVQNSLEGGKLFWGCRLGEGFFWSGCHVFGDDIGEGFVIDGYGQAGVDDIPEGMAYFVGTDFEEGEGYVGVVLLDGFDIEVDVDGV